jgi:dTDP-4-dehydrorhamnose 3,5-epimerase/reductase
MNKKTLVLGAKGQLGTALHTAFPDAVATDISELDITSQESVDAFDWDSVGVILNAAAYTRVDDAETESGRAACWNVNAAALARITKAIQGKDIIYVHVSTDYVFDGREEAHHENELFAPLSVYGASKAAGDLIISTLPKHYIFRTSWVIGEGNNFVRTMIGVAKKGIDPKVVNDQFGRLTFTQELVRIITWTLEKQLPYGTYNATNGGPIVSWFDITQAIYEEAEFKNKVLETTTEAYMQGRPHVAKRPVNSALDLTKLQGLGFINTDWRDDLAVYVKNELAKENA